MSKHIVPSPVYTKTICRWKCTIRCLQKVCEHINKKFTNKMQSKKLFFYKTQPLNVLLNYNEYLCACVSFFVPSKFCSKTKYPMGKVCLDKLQKLEQNQTAPFLFLFLFLCFIFASASRSTNLLLDFHFRVRVFGWILRLNFIKSLK